MFAVAFQSIRGTHKSSTRRYARYRTEIPVIVKVLAKDSTQAFNRAVSGSTADVERKPSLVRTGSGYR